MLLKKTWNLILNVSPCVHACMWLSVQGCQNGTSWRWKVICYYKFLKYHQISKYIYFFFSNLHHRGERIFSSSSYLPKNFEEIAHIKITHLEAYLSKQFICLPKSQRFFPESMHCWKRKFPTTFGSCVLCRIRDHSCSLATRVHILNNLIERNIIKYID